MSEKYYADEINFEKAYDEAIGLLRSLLAGSECGPIGFVASNLDIDNYKRLFTRDTFWIGMAALLSGEPDLIGGFRSSLEVLRDTQRRDDGAIASNVSCDGKVSYGIINPRVDPTSLYIIGCVEYYRHTGDGSFLAAFIPSVRGAMGYLEDVWENKACGLLYIPRAGNWADEYFQQGFVLYDEVLWNIALKKYAYALKELGDGRAGEYREKASGVKKLIREKFWIKNTDVREDHVYRSMRKKLDLNRAGYFLHFYYSGDKVKADFAHAHGIFDAFGNSLALLEGFPGETQREHLLRFVDIVSDNWYPLIPAHYPFFKENTFRSKKLHQFRFKESIGHYHNGGLWPWYTGVFVSALAKAGEDMRAIRFLHGILRANAQEKDGHKFHEYHSMKKSEAILEVVRPEGLDLYFSMKLSHLVSTHRSNMRVKYRNFKVDVTDRLCEPLLLPKQGERVRFGTVGPDAKDVLLTIPFMKDRSGRRYFRNVEMRSIRSEPDGTGNLGVSAAAYVIAYKAVAEGKILFA